MTIPEFPRPTHNIDHATDETKLTTAPELQAPVEQTAAMIAVTIRDQQEQKGFVDLDWLETGHADG